MEPNRSLFSAIKTEKEKVDSILLNVCIMLSNRIYIDEEGKKNKLFNMENYLDNIEDEGDRTYVIHTLNKKIYALKIIFQQITSLSEKSNIYEFLKGFDKYNKIIVASGFSSKVAKTIRANKKTQIFDTKTFMFDYMSNIDQPRFELLTPDEMKQFKKEYNVTDYTIKKMERKDFVRSYFALKKGEIVRIIRPSPTSGESIDYRIVS